jgi:hypothetical protein
MAVLVKDVGMTTLAYSARRGVEGTLANVGRRFLRFDG